MSTQPMPAQSMPVPPVTLQRAPLVELRDIQVSFGGVRAVAGVTLDLYPGEVVGLVGGNGAGKTTLMRTLSGARPPDSGQIRVGGQAVTIANPRDAKALGIETIYQTLALADNLDAPANVFLGRELTATGETVRKRSTGTVTTLTAQEALIAQLARDGRTNPEIGAQLFLSGRTIEWHLRNIFTKLGISSRRDLHAALTQAA